MRLWGGRFSEENDARVADFTRSIELDRELAADDLAGSIAHVRGLGRAGLLTDRRGRRARRRARRRSPRTSPPDRFAWDPASRTSISTSRRRWPSGSGRSPGELHTGRSRNDQVATDLRLWTAPRHRSTRRRARRLRARARRSSPSARATAVLPGHDPHPAGAAGAVRPPPARLRRDGRARSRPPRRRAPARQRLPARRRGAGGRRLPARSRGDGRASSGSTA